MPEYSRFDRRPGNAEPSDDRNKHQVSNISESTVGAPVRKRAGKPANPFSEGDLVMARTHDAGKYLSYSTRIDDLHDLLCPQVGAPKICIKLYINGTRVTSRRSLLRSIIRPSKALNLYQLIVPVACNITEEDRQKIRDFERILSTN